MAPRRLLVLGLDGASFEVIRPLAAAGRLPFLAKRLGEGLSAPLRSTVPAMSFPAWSSFLTGREPGEHGLFDFTQKLPGAYAIRFTNASDRTGASLFARVSAARGRVLGLGVPATYPPDRVHGLVVPGFDAPVSSGSDARAASDPGLYRAVAERTGAWMVADDGEGAGGDGWDERAVTRLLARVRRKTDFAREALTRLRDTRCEGPELACVVFAESDTVAHHFWRDHDPDSPRHDPRASATRRNAVASVYEALDAACAELHAAFGEQAPCVVVSDHGSGGAARHVVHLGRRLEEAGLLARRRGPGGSLDAVARGLRDRALRWLPARAAEAVFRRTRAAAARVESAARFGGVDWRATAAFSEDVNTQPGVWINLAGREARGSVAPQDYERVREDTIAALLDWKLPGGGPVVARASRREEVYAGARVDRAPDVVVELADCAGYGLSVVPTPWGEGAGPSVRTLGDDELAGGRGRGLNGTHRPDGVWIAHGENVGLPDGATRPRLARVAPALLTALGVAESDAADSASPAPRRYTEREEAQVAARLRSLGYLE